MNGKNGKYPPFFPEKFLCENQINIFLTMENRGKKPEKPCAAAVFGQKTFFQKSVDKRVGSCYNIKRCRENSKRAEGTAAAILENDTEIKSF